MKKCQMNHKIENAGKRIGGAFLLFCALMFFVWSQKSGETQIYELFLNGELTVEQDEKQLTISELFLDNDVEYCFLDIDGDGKVELHIRDNTLYYVINAEGENLQIIFKGQAYDDYLCYKPVVEEPCGILHCHGGYGFELLEFIEISADGGWTSDGEFIWRDENENGYMDETDYFKIGFFSGEESGMKGYMHYREEQFARKAEKEVKWTSRRLKEFATWQEAYTDFIKKTEDIVNNKDKAYSLTYVDGDDVPELFIDTWYGVTGEYIASFYDGKMRAVNLARGGMNYIENGGLLYTWDSKVWEPGHLNIYVLEKGDFSNVRRGWSSGNYENGLDQVSFDYFWVDRPVTEEEFWECVDNVIDTSKCISPVRHAKDEILEMLSNPESLDKVKKNEADRLEVYEPFLNGELTVEWEEEQITIDELFGDNDIEYCFLDIDGDGKAELHIRDNTVYYVIKDVDGEPQIFFQSWWRDYEPVVTDEQCGFLNYFNLGYGTNERICFLKMDADGKREWDEVYWSDENENRCMDKEDKFTRETDNIAAEEIDMEQYLQYKDKYYVNQNELVWTVRRLKEFETWQEAYTDFLLKSKITWFYNEPEDKYALAYLDEDDIPELICYMAGGNNVIVVTFYNGKVRILNPSTWGKIKYMEYDGRFYVKDDDCDVYLLNEGKFSLIGRGWDYGQYYFYTGYRYRYFWEGTEVTEAEYEECINKVIDTSKCIEPSLVYTEDEMLEMIGDNDEKNIHSWHGA